MEHLAYVLTRSTRRGAGKQVTTLNTLFGVVGDEALYTRVVVISQRRTELFYSTLLGALLDRMCLVLSITMADIAWESFTLDFETALIPALTMLSSVAFVPLGRSLLLDGCFFHFAAALFKYLCSVGLKVEYGEEPYELKLFLKRLTALAFCDPNEIPATFLLIVANHWPASIAVGDNRLVQFLEYMDRQWIHNPKVPIAMWSVFNVERHRTNNKLESKHKYMRTIFGVHQPLWTFLEKLGIFFKRELEDERSHRVQAQSTHRPQEKKVAHTEKRLNRQKEMYVQKQITALQYVLAIAGERFLRR